MRKITEASAAIAILEIAVAEKRRSRIAYAPVAQLLSNLILKRFRVARQPPVALKLVNEIDLRAPGRKQVIAPFADSPIRCRFVLFGLSFRVATMRRCVECNKPPLFCQFPRDSRQKYVVGRKLWGICIDVSIQNG